MCKKPLTKIFPAAIAILILSFSTPAQAQSGDEAFFSVRVDPNIVILLDNSGSMYHLVWRENYNDATAYTGAFTGDRTYYLVDNATSSATFGHAGTSPRLLWWYDGGWLHQHSDAAGQFTSGGRTVTLPWPYAGAMPSFDAARFKGNYLNWIFNSTSGASTADIASLPQQTRIQVAREVINNLISTLTDMRLSIYRFNTYEGGSQVYPMTTLNASTPSSTRTDMQTAVNNILANTWTPLSESLYNVWQYYQTTGAGAPIQYACQKNFVIVVTDGLPTCDGVCTSDASCNTSAIVPNAVLTTTALPGYDTPNGAGTCAFEGATNYLENVARYMYLNDARSGGSMSGLQNVMTYTVGFSINTTLLQNTAMNGGGQYFTAQTSAQLTDAIESAIIDISNQATSFTSPTVPTLRAVDGSIVYEAKFNPSTTPFWKGYLYAYNIDANGDITSTQWEAGSMLAAATGGSRTVYTTRGGARIDFTNGTLTNADLGVATDAERLSTVNYVRGEGLSAWSFRCAAPCSNPDGEWKLQDIFHSGPVVVGAPSPYLTESGYPGFYSANSGRTKIILAGANDGMLHAFSASTGQESWSWVPPDLLTKLDDSRSSHQYFVDSSVRAEDVWTGSGTGATKSSSDWKTFAIVGERQGGNSYMALDITSTTNPGWKWSYTDATYMGNTWSRPAVGRVRIGSDEVWVAVFSGGYNADEAPTSRLGKGIFIVNITDGTLLKRFDFDSVAGNQMKYSIPGPPMAVDVNNDGFIDRIYAGDLGNNLWRIDVSPTATASWTATKLFDAPAGVIRPIYTEPTAAFDTQGRLWVYFGTGDRMDPMNDSAQEKFYAIMDCYNGTPAGCPEMGEYPTLSINDLDNITVGTYDGDKNGWYLNLSGSGEKMLTSPTVIGGVVLFTTFDPAGSADPCSAGGSSNLYAIDYTTGAGEFSGGGRSVSLGAGFASAPIPSITYNPSTGQTSTTVFVSTTTGGVTVAGQGGPDCVGPNCISFDPTTSLIDSLYWRDRRVR